MSEWIIENNEVTGAHHDMLRASFIISSEDGKERFIFEVLRAVLDDQYKSDDFENTLQKANQDQEIKRFLDMSVRLISYGFRNSNPGKHYLITRDIFTRFFR